jgi:fructose-bisphosphate aldolase class II
MLVTLKQILDYAQINDIAIGAFNTPNLESIQAVIESAEELKQPVIIQFAQCHEYLNPLEIIGPIMVSMAEKAKVAVCVHLDHGETLDYLNRALELGFTSIMYDGSNLSYEDNIKNTKEAVLLARKYNASIEAELGSMGSREDGSGSNESNPMIYTDVQLSKDFVSKTNIDALACSFGTVHGIYVKQPHLDFNIVKQIRNINNNIPIVMHGGSGVSKLDYLKAILSGVRKINYFTYMDLAGGDIMKELDLKDNIYFSSVSELAKENMKKCVKRAICIFTRKE